jgi:hypothetical protein
MFRFFAPPYEESSLARLVLHRFWAWCLTEVWSGLDLGGSKFSVAPEIPVPLSNLTRRRPRICRSTSPSRFSSGRYQYLTEQS